ncbi:hypothetical protein EON65_47785 [archaeon]|nr:MAG: hypothetical protein EON65_47785 [archaeon]
MSSVCGHLIASQLLCTQMIRKYNSKTSEVRMRSNFRGTYEKVTNPPSSPPRTQSIPLSKSSNTLPS